MISDSDIEMARRTYARLHQGKNLSYKQAETTIQVFQELSRLLTISNGPFDCFDNARKEVNADITGLKIMLEHQCDKEETGA
jgi:hypothetical protein